MECCLKGKRLCNRWRKLTDFSDQTQEILHVREIIFGKKRSRRLDRPGNTARKLNWYVMTETGLNYKDVGNLWL